MATELSFEVTLNETYEKTIERVVAALKDEGFGVLTRIDVKATLKEKLGEDFRPYVILGACNPPLAHRALSANAQAGIMLPCNVTVEEAGGENTLVRIANPEAMMQVGQMAESTALRDVALEARARLERVANALKN